MKIFQTTNKKKALKLIIDHDDSVGFYLLVYKLNSGGSIADYLCDSLDDAFFEAKRRYGIDSKSWEKLPNK